MHENLENHLQSTHADNRTARRVRYRSLNISPKLTSVRQGVDVHKEHSPPRGDPDDGTTIHRPVLDYEKAQPGHDSKETTDHHEDPTSFPLLPSKTS